MSVSKQPKNCHLQMQGHTPLPWIRQQGRPPRSVSDKKGGAGHHFLFTQQGWQGGLRGRTRRQARVSMSVKRQRENTMRRWAHRGIRTQRWHMRLMAVWETKQQNRSGCKRMRHAAVLPSRDWRLLGTSKPNLVLLQSRAIPLCSMHLPVGTKDGQGVSKRSDMPTCRSRIDHVSH